jgi:hypothetical protein
MGIVRGCRTGANQAASRSRSYDYCAKQYGGWRKACDAVMPSLKFATFLLRCVDSEAIEQEGDNCFGVARCHGFSDSMSFPTTREKV